MTDTSNPNPNPAPPKSTFDKARAEKDLSWLGARLREPSTYAGLAALLAVFHLSTDPGLAHSPSMIGMGLGGVIAFLLPEAK
jgi:hypothetical protein